MAFDITNYKSFIDKCFYPDNYTLEEIEKGLSDDIKFKADADGRSYIVKIVEGKKNTPYKSNRSVLYQALCRAHAEDARVVCPKWFDYIDNHIVTVTEWIEGASLEEYLYSHPSKQIEYGKQVGKLLFNIHNLGFVKSEIEKSNEKFAPKAMEKVDGLLDSVKRLNLSFPGIERVVEFLRNNKDVISEERVGILHSDVRPENILIDGGRLFLIDFDSGTFGDRYAEFTYLTALACKDFRAFAYAVIMSYFDGAPPRDFWKANLYFCMIKLLEYAVYKFNKSGKMVVNQAQSCMKIFKGFDEVIPDWWDEEDRLYGKEFTLK